MGVGTNIQARAVALHHIDCPWRPADIEQREGRVLRQGNQNAEVGIYRYVVEGSFDAYSWQTVERKARFISQIMRGRLDVREVEDIGDTALSFAEVKALASGDPLILEKATVDAERTRLQRLERAHQRNRHTLEYTATDAERRFERTARELPAIHAAAAAALNTRGEAFRMVVDGRSVQGRPEAAALVQQWAASHAQAAIPYARSERTLGECGELGGLPIEATLRKSPTGRPTLELSIRGVAAHPATLALDEVGENASSLIRKLEHRIADLPALAERTEAAGDAAAGEAAHARQARDQPFKHTTALSQVTARSLAITTEMQERQQPAPETETPDSESAGVGQDAEAAECQRIAAANFAAAASPAATSPATPAARRAHQPGRENDLSR